MILKSVVCWLLGRCIPVRSRFPLVALDGYRPTPHRCARCGRPVQMEQLGPRMTYARPQLEIQE